MSSMSIPYGEIDPRIRRLVYALNGVGIKTLDASCEGHNDRPYVHSHPWVAIDPNSSVELLDGMVDRYNRQHEIQWERRIRGESAKTVLETVTYRELCSQCGTDSEEISELQLEELKISAEQLALFIEDNINP